MKRRPSAAAGRLYTQSREPTAADVLGLSSSKGLAGEAARRHTTRKLEPPRLVLVLVVGRCRGPNALVQPVVADAAGTIARAVGTPYVRPFRGLRRA